jgi:hypothetical protein
MKLLIKNFTDAQYLFLQWLAIVPVGTTPQDLESPEFWANAAQKMNDNGMIHVQPEDKSFYARLIIRSKGPNWANVKLIEFVDLESPNEGEVDGQLKISWAGQNHKFRVTRKSDGQVLQHGFATRGEAAAWAKKMTLKAA